MNDLNNDKWTDAAEKQMTSLKKNHTWSLIDRPKDQKANFCIKIFKRKPGIVGVESPSYKARLVTKGYSQKKGIDYQKMFAPVVKHVSIRYLLYIVVHFNMELQ